MTDSSADVSSGEFPDHMPVDYSTLHKILFHDCLENGRGLCITVGKSKNFISLCEFEHHGGKAATRNWNKFIQCNKQPIGDFLQEYIGKCCSQLVLSGSLPYSVSSLVACLASRGSPMGASSTGRTPASSSTCLFISSSSASI